MRKAQANVEYLILVGLVLIALIPIFYYISRINVGFKTTGTDDMVSTFGHAVREVYSLGAGNRVVVTIDIPKGVVDAQINGTELQFTVIENGEYVDYYVLLPGPVVLENGIDWGDLAGGTVQFYVESEGESPVCIWKTNNEGCPCKQGFTAPVINFLPSGNKLECSEDWLNWQPCENQAFSDPLKAVRVNVSDNESDYNYVRFSLTATTSNLFVNRSASSNTTSNSSPMGYTIFYYNTSSVYSGLNRSGPIYLSVEVQDNCWQSNSTTYSWSVPWGTLTPYLINLSAGKNVSQNGVFSFAAGFSCSGGECWNVNATLDPWQVN